ncbi:hypothetical protein CROQUDRAFT_89127 [Cronartium quercuum f. sp. fusiforme G11]|uniref:25S rRNA (uridine-N(3))-methyltransferase BMT5-like domain-containing protein n=1 Tax=Cronartium quercuum f. sp. fusiforme G11 TaxID=708437 RepID=A0A9P6NSN2_9BASI|nr:hypothetical protein CROQUDRAFT_89127 [Cronartium quercuum f. sp. fusiforme G11]
MFYHPKICNEDASAKRKDQQTPSDNDHLLHEPENSPTIRSESKLAPKTKNTPATTSPSHKPPKLKAQSPSSSALHQTMCQDSAEKRSKPDAKKMAEAQPLIAKKAQSSPNPSNTKGQSPSIKDAVLKTSAKERIVTLQAKVATPLPSFSKQPSLDHDSEEVEEHVSGEGTTRRPKCNFSFAASLVLYHSHPGHLLTATTNDSEETISQKYPDAAEFIKALKAQKVNVLFELDA